MHWSTIFRGYLRFALTLSRYTEMSKKITLLLLLPLFMCSSLDLFAQEEDDEIDQQIPNNVRDSDKRWKWERAFIGGNVGAYFGNETYIDLSPSFGYFVHDRVAVGLGAIYQYNRFSYITDSVFKTSTYGGRVFARGYILEQLFTHAEFELLNLGVFDAATYEELGRVNVKSLPVGIGYAQRFGGYSAFNIMLLYDVLQSEFSPYGNRAIIRMGFGIGL